MRLADRVLQTAWRLVLALILLGVATPVLIALVRAATQSIGRWLSSALTGLGSSFGAVLLGLFVLGGLVRVGRTVRRTLTETVRDRSQGQRSRTASRRRAEGVPPFGKRDRIPDDPDPNLEI